MGGDSTTTDAAVPDGGADSGTVDAGDSGADAGDSGIIADAGDSGAVDAGNPKAACNAFIAANNTGPNALGAKSTTCTDTEYGLYEKDNTGACLSCAFQQGCLDDTVANPTGLECDDFTAQADKAACLAVLRCDLGDTHSTGAFGKSPVVSNIVEAFCGPGSSACAASPGGPCVAVWKAGFPSTYTNQNVIDSDTFKAYAAGRGNQVMSCAIGNFCDVCK